MSVEVSPVRSVLVRELTIPNVLSATRLPIALVFPFARSRTTALALIAAAGITDMLDGWSARRLGISTKTGAALDGLADKLFAVSVLATLLGRRILSPGDALLLAAREAFELPLALRVLATPRSRASAVDRSANRLGKLATTLQLAAVVGAVMRWRHRKPLVLAAGIAGAVAGLSYWSRELRAERERDEDDDRTHVPYLLAGGSLERLAELAA